MASNNFFFILLYSNNLKWQLLSRRKLTTNLYRMSGEPQSHLQSKSKYCSCVFECLIVNIKTNYICPLYIFYLLNSQIWASKLQRISWEKNQVNYKTDILRTEISENIKNTTHAFSSGSCGKLTETKYTSESRYWKQFIDYSIIDHQKGLFCITREMSLTIIIILGKDKREGICCNWLCSPWKQVP